VALPPAAALRPGGGQANNYGTLLSDSKPTRMTNADTEHDTMHPMSLIKYADDEITDGIAGWLSSGLCVET
jgi:hypothetical protein